MSEIREVRLPGLGVRHEFTTHEGERVGVVSHRSGRKEVYLADRFDPDAFKRMIVLGDDDARTLAEILGGSRVAEELAQLQQRIEGLAIDWLPVREDSPYAGPDDWRGTGENAHRRLDRGGAERRASRPRTGT